MAAGDTFRAAAAEQLTVWADRAGQKWCGAKKAATRAPVIYDAIERAPARDADLVLADTAGRLHNKFNLMEELKKIKRISERPPARSDRNFVGARCHHWPKRYAAGQAILRRC